MALAYFDPVIESCNAAWQLKLTLYNAAPYGPKSGTNNYLDFGKRGKKKIPELVTLNND